MVKIKEDRKKIREEYNGCVWNRQKTVRSEYELWLKKKLEIKRIDIMTLRHGEYLVSLLLFIHEI